MLIAINPPQVNWQDEQQCLRDIASLLADLYLFDAARAQQQQFQQEQQRQFIAHDGYFEDVCLVVFLFIIIIMIYCFTRICTQ